MNKSMGILGGAFDPIHFGHLRSAWEVMTILDLSQIQFIPYKQAVHKTQPIAASTHRYTMLLRATESVKEFFINNYELISKGSSYTIDTLIHLRNQYPNESLSLLIGTDAFMSLPTWHRWEELTNYAHIIVMHRPGYSLKLSGTLERFVSNCLTKNSDELHQSPNGKIHLQLITELNISSTDIRRQLQAHSLPRFLIPENVLAYIQQHQLYQPISEIIDIQQ